MSTQPTRLVESRYGVRSDRQTYRAKGTDVTDKTLTDRITFSDGQTTFETTGRELERISSRLEPILQVGLDFLLTHHKQQSKPGVVMSDPESLQALLTARKQALEEDAAKADAAKRDEHAKATADAWKSGTKPTYGFTDDGKYADFMAVADEPIQPEKVLFSVKTGRRSVALVAYPTAAGIVPGDMLAAVVGAEPQTVTDPDGGDNLGSFETIRALFTVQKVTGRIVIADFMPRDGSLEWLAGMPTFESGDRFVPVSAEDAAMGHIFKSYR